MSSPRDARSALAVALRCARSATGAGGAAYLPFVEGAEAAALGLGADAARSLLSAGDQGALRAGEVRRGRSGPGAWLGAPVCSPGGGPCGALVVVFAPPAEEGPGGEEALRDLCRLFEETLARPRVEEGEFARFFELSEDNLCIASFDGFFKLLNPRWTETLGYTLEELYARPYIEFVHPEDRPRTGEESSSIRRGERTITFSNRYIARDGSICHLQWTAVPAPEHERIYAVARNVTEQKRFEEELKQSRAAALTANQAKSAFLAMMSHELRTPLNSVIGFANLLIDNEAGRLGSDELMYAERVHRNGEDLLGLINSILDLSRIEAGRVEPVLDEADLCAVARDVIETLRPQAPGRVELRLELPPRPVSWLTDADRLRQILLNLVGNGLKFTARGSVILRLAEHPLRFEVEDTGPGIARENLDTVFEPFRQLEEGAGRRHGGTGLGLAISRSFADALGLRIGIESALGRGTLFRIALEGEREPGV